MWIGGLPHRRLYKSKQTHSRWCGRTQITPQRTSKHTETSSKVYRLFIEWVMPWFAVKTTRLTNCREFHAYFSIFLPHHFMMMSTIIVVIMAMSWDAFCEWLAQKPAAGREKNTWNICSLLCHSDSSMDTDASSSVWSEEFDLESETNIHSRLLKLQSCTSYFIHRSRILIIMKKKRKKRNKMKVNFIKDALRCRIPVVFGKIQWNEGKKLPIAV